MLQTKLICKVWSVGKQESQAEVLSVDVSEVEGGQVPGRDAHIELGQVRDER